MTAPHKDEITAVNLADDHAEEATASLEKAKATADSAKATVAALCAIADGILAHGARIDALREMFNRELPEIGAAVDTIARETELP